MRSLFLIWLLSSPAIVMLAQSFPDTLEANIGGSAKVIFLGSDAEKLGDIAKYDLNLLFDELYQRTYGAEAAGIRLLDDEEASGLLRSKRKKGLPLRVNFYAGYSLPRNYDVSYQQAAGIPAEGENLRFETVTGEIRQRGRGSLGITIGTAFKLIERQGYRVDLKTSFGFEWTGMATLLPEFRIISPIRQITDTLVFTDPSGQTVSQFQNDTTGWTDNTISIEEQSESFSHLFLEFLPTVSFKRSNGNAGFSFGAGGRFGPDLSNEGNRPSGCNYFAFDGSLVEICDNPFAITNPRSWFFAGLATVGYGRFNLQITYLPSSVFKPFRNRFGGSGSLGTNEQDVRPSWNVGLRYGL